MLEVNKRDDDIAEAIKIIYNSITYPDTQLAMERTKTTLLIEETRSYVHHEDIWVVNSEGVALRYP